MSTNCDHECNNCNNNCCSVTIPDLNIAELAAELLLDETFIDGIVLIVGDNITSNLFLITPPAAPGDPIAIDLTVTGTGGIVVTNPLPGFLNIDGSGAASIVDDGFGTTVRGDGSALTPYRVDTQLSSNSLLITPPIINGDPVAVDLTITGTNGITATNPIPGTWNISGTAPVTATASILPTTFPWAVAVPADWSWTRNGNAVTVVGVNTANAPTTAAVPLTYTVLPVGFRPTANQDVAVITLQSGVQVPGWMTISTLGVVVLGPLPTQSYAINAANGGFGTVEATFIAP